MKVNVGKAVALASVALMIFLCGCGGTTPAKVTATIPVGLRPIAVAVNPATNRIYVLNQCCSPGSVSVIDGVTNSVVATAPVGGSPCQVAVNSQSNKIYVTNSSNQSVTVIDGATNAATTVSVGSQPCALAVDSTSNKVYVANGDATVTVIDGASNNTATVTLAANPTHIAVNSVTHQVYISVGRAPEANVTVLDGATNQILNSFPLGEFTALSIAVNTAANEAYVLENFYHASGALIIDGASLQIVGGLGTAELGGPSDTVGFNAKTGKVYLLYPGSFYEFDRVTKRVTVMLPTSQLATTLLVDDSINQIYVLIAGQLSDPVTPGSVMVVDGASHATTTLQVGVNPSALALNTATNRVYVTNLSCFYPDCFTAPVAGTVSVIEATH